MNRSGELHHKTFKDQLEPYAVADVKEIKHDNLAT